MKPLPRWWSATSEPRSLIVSPIRLLSGVYGGAAASLSVRAVLPKFVEMEESYGSLCRAMLAGRKKLAEMRKAKGLRSQAAVQFAEGRHAADDRCHCRPPQSAEPAHRNRRQPALAKGRRLGVDYSTRSRALRRRHLRHPARIASNMLAAVNAQLSEDLGKVEYSSSITVTLGYQRDELKSCPPGFGFLVPRSEGTRMLATTFVHTKFPFRAPDNKALVRCFLGGASDQSVLKFSDEEVTAIVRKELKQITGLTADPWFVKVYRWDRAMAQYTPGHLERIERIGANPEADAEPLHRRKFL